MTLDLTFGLTPGRGNRFHFVAGWRRSYTTVDHGRLLVDCESP
jgi:hypothetical protein